MTKHALVAGSIVLLSACGEATPEARNRVVDDGSIARASVTSPACGSRASLIDLPDHCAWPQGSRRSKLLGAEADVVVVVDEHDVARGARVVRGTNDDELDGAVVACAMQGRYRAAWNGAGETCAVTIRLARYPSDVAPRRVGLPGDCVQAAGYPPMAVIGAAPAWCASDPEMLR